MTIRIEDYITHQGPDYMPLARHWLKKMNEYFADPEYSAACDKWKAMRAEGRMDEAEAFLQEFYEGWYAKRRKSQ